MTPRLAAAFRSVRWVGWRRLGGEVITVEVLAAAAVLSYVTYFAYVRLRYGVNFTDEAYYAVLTQRFTLGDRPYVDEINLRQTSGLLTVPFYWLYLKVVGSTDGIVYFLRQLYFAVECVLALAVFRLVRRQVGLAAALLAAAVPVTFIPFAIPACSYNTLGGSLFALGTVLGMGRILTPGSPHTLSLAGAAHGLACVAYPPMGIPVLVVAGATWLAFPRDRALSPGRAALRYVLGVAAAGAPFLIIVAPGLLGGLSKALEYEGMFTGKRGLDKLDRVVEAIARLAPGEFAAPAILGAAWAVGKTSPAVRPYLVPALAIPVVWWFRQVRPEHAGLVTPHTLTLHIMIYLGLLGAFLAWLIQPRARARALFLWGFCPAIIAGVVTAFASDNTGCMNAGTGLFAAALLFPVAAIPGRGEHRTDAGGAAAAEGGLAAWGRRLPPLFALGVVALMMVRLSFQSTYFDGPVKVHDTKVASGPFRGLYTSASKAEQAESLAREIRPLWEPEQRMLVYYAVPAAYLAVPTRPALQTAWTDHRAIIAPLLPYYHQQRTGRGLVISITSNVGRSRDLENLVEHPSRLLKDTGWFRIWREPPPSAR